MLGFYAVDVRRRRRTLARSIGSIAVLQVRSPASVPPAPRRRRSRSLAPSRATWSRPASPRYRLPRSARPAETGARAVRLKPFPGGEGAQIRADFAVSPGSVLYVEVGGTGTNGEPTIFCTNGTSAGGLSGASASGGAGGAVGGGGGGGASQVLTVPAAIGANTSQLIVAGGGGGAGANQGAGGNAGGPGGAGSGGGSGGGATLT